MSVVVLSPKLAVEFFGPALLMAGDVRAGDDESLVMGHTHKGNLQLSGYRFGRKEYRVVAPDPTDCWGAKKAFTFSKGQVQQAIEQFLSSDAEACYVEVLDAGYLRIAFAAECITVMSHELGKGVRDSLVACKGPARTRRVSDQPVSAPVYSRTRVLEETLTSLMWKIFKVGFGAARKRKPVLDAQDIVWLTSVIERPKPAARIRQDGEAPMCKLRGEPNSNDYW